MRWRFSSVHSPSNNRAGIAETVAVITAFPRGAKLGSVAEGTRNVTGGAGGMTPARQESYARRKRLERGGDVNGPQASVGGFDETARRKGELRPGIEREEHPRRLARHAKLSDPPHHIARQIGPGDKAEQAAFEIERRENRPGFEHLAAAKADRPGAVFNEFDVADLGTTADFGAGSARRLLERKAQRGQSARRHA